MEKKTILWIIIALLAVAVLYITFFKGSSTGAAVETASQAVQQVSSGMVGGC